jgi:hypothetical protein
MVMELATRKQLLLYDGRQITGPIAWSPDSCCLSFSDKGNALSDFLTRSQARIIVYRLSDREWFRVTRLGPFGGTSHGFGWFYDYKTFLMRNDEAARPLEGR